MSWTNICFFALLLTSVSGTIMFLLWQIARMILENGKGVAIIYPLLLLVVLSYSVPIMYLVFWIGNRMENGSPVTGDFFYLTPQMLRTCRIGCLVWIVGVLAAVGKNVYHYIKVRKVLNGNIEDFEDWFYQSAALVKDELKLRKKIELYQNDLMGTPVLWGRIKEAVILPYRSYQPKELQIILLHEMVHSQRRDLWVRMWVMMLTVIHWFNPFVFLLRKQIVEWSETSCDIDAIRNGTNICTAKEYFEVIVEQKINGPQNPMVMTSLFGSENDLKKRIQRVRNYRMKKQLKTLGSLGVLSLLLLSCCLTSVAAGNGLENACTEWYKVTDVNTSMDVFQNGNTLVEYEEPLDDDFLNRIEIEGEEGIDTLSTTVPINWTIGGSKVKSSSGFYKTKGSTVAIAVSVNPESKYTKVGLITPTMKRYVDGYGFISHEFEINESGIHYVFIENSAGDSIEVVGFYVK